MGENRCWDGNGKSAQSPNETRSAECKVKAEATSRSLLQARIDIERVAARV